ncbi:MAG: septum formation protein Maf [Prevotella sp.]|nr:septum formation protein Maf [Prevotella sp.]
MLDNLRKYHVVLASNSPRRRELLAGLGVDFEVRVMAGIDESYPDDMSAMKAAEYVAGKKAAAYKETLGNDELLIAADTMVIAEDEVMGKPHDEADALRMLGKLSGKTHHVVTGVCIVTKERQSLFSVVTDVTFKELSHEETEYYVNNYHPLDKAGAYGIQEWIGFIGCTGLEGSYFNVMGLPVQRIYTELLKF